MEAKSRRIASHFLKLLDFWNFCSNIHDKIKCDVDTCEYEKSATGLKSFLAWNASVHNKKLIYFSFCQIYADAFLSY